MAATLAEAVSEPEALSPILSNARICLGSSFMAATLGSEAVSEPLSLMRE